MRRYEDTVASPSHFHVALDYLGASEGQRPLDADAEGPKRTEGAWRWKMEPVVGFEPTTCCLRNSCSTAELHRPSEPTPGLEPGTSILPRLCSAS